MSDTRPYSSPLRERQAQQTRERILRAARRRFEADGFPTTTVRDIAEEAEVSVPSVYAAFGSKAGLVVGLLDQLEADAEAAGEGAGRDAKDLDEALVAWVDAHVRIFSRGVGLFRVMREARAEVEVTELWERGDRHRRGALESLVRLAVTNDTIPADSSAGIVDEMWAISSIDVYLDLIDRCGWTNDDYAGWLRRAIDPRR